MLDDDYEFPDDNYSDEEEVKEWMEVLEFRGDDGESVEHGTNGSMEHSVKAPKVHRSRRNRPHDLILTPTPL